MSSMVCLAQVGLGLPERLAEGAASGTPAASIILRVVRMEGNRTATVASPAETSSGIRSLLGRMMVSGPGQNSRASAMAFSGM